ncbi:MAG TPA: flagellar hook-basal body complex protein FliE [Ignavibacteriaceae bacterium]|nr:flagellar hook-basal body complex protein FliE [Ignavibacteriaceae bacterium]
MKIGEITNNVFPEIALKKIAENNEGPKFENVLTDFIGNVNNDQLTSSKMTQQFVAGDNVEIHEVMIAGEKAQTSLQLLMEIRNKTVDMYKELTRMPV